jgi:Effector-associated domain 1/Ubiquitin-conjugating enzyme
MALTLQQVSALGGLNALADAFESGDNARALLERIGYPRNIIPQGTAHSLAFWQTVCQQIDNGLTEGGFEALFGAALQTYPHNRRFREIPNADGQPAVAPPAPGGAQHPGRSLLIRGCDDIYFVVDTARDIVRERRMQGTVELDYHSAGMLMISLLGLRPQEVETLERELSGRLERRGISPSISQGPTEFRDYLFRNIIAEGPDGSQFEMTNVPGSTRFSDVATAVMNQYDLRAWGKDKSGKPKPATVDYVKPEGKPERMRPEVTLHQAGIPEGATLQVHPEATAGAIDPRLRNEALARVKLQVMAYALANPGFEVTVDFPEVPTEYVFRFSAPSWGPPPAAGDEPVPIDRHEVFLAMPPDFPIKAPEVFWQTPIFHPNIHLGSGWVCLGELADRYRPGIDFGQLCQMLVDIANYSNYATEEGHNQDAQRWALSPSGQFAIERRGGRSVARKYLESVQQARPIEIRRVAE